MFESAGKFKPILLAVNLILCALGLIIIGTSAWLLIKPDYVFNIVLENNGQENRDDIKMARLGIANLFNRIKNKAGQDNDLVKHMLIGSRVHPATRICWLSLIGGSIRFEKNRYNFDSGYTTLIAGFLKICQVFRKSTSILNVYTTVLMIAIL